MTGAASGLCDHCGEVPACLIVAVSDLDGTLHDRAAICRLCLRAKIADVLTVAPEQPEGPADLFRVGPWNVRIVRPGDSYGAGDCLTHPADGPPMVEFYDARQDVAKFGPRGQFVSRYYLTTLLARQPGPGLVLYGGVPEWTVTGADMDRVLTFLQDWQRGHQ